MSTQSIFHNTLYALFDGIEDTYMCMANKHIIKKRYRVGEDYDIVDYKTLIMLDRIICEDKCLIDVDTCKIKEKINIINQKYK